MTLNFVDKRIEIYLPTLSKKSKNKSYLIFDVETQLKKISDIEEQHIPKLISAKMLHLDSLGNYESEDTVFFFTVKDFHFWVFEKIKKHHTIYMLGHNSGYDVITSRLFELFDMLKMKCVAFNPKTGSYFVHFAGKRSRVIIMDNYNFFQSALADIAEQLDFKKLVMPKTKGVTLQWIKYCIRDVDIVEKCLIKLSQYLAKFNLGHLEITVASTAFNVFRKHFHQTNMLISKNIQAVRMEYLAYFGGRTEMFQYGKLEEQDYFYYDFNSLYPSVMKNNLYSIKLRRHFPVSSLDQLSRFITSYGCIARVTVKVDKPYFPKKMGNFTAFPVGTFETTLTTPELKFGLENNLIIKVHNLSTYYQKEIFNKYIDYFHKQKQQHKKENNPVYTLFDKLMLNSLYGKFGQKINSLEKLSDGHEENYKAFDYVDLDKMTLEKRKIINHVEYIEKKDLIGYYSIPSIAAEVTSYARIKLLKVFIAIGWDNVYYCDTDSVITNKKGKKIIDKLFAGNNLGDLELEKSSNSVSLFALKDYKFGDEVRKKSIPKKSKKIGKNEYEFTHFNTTIESLRTNKKDGMFTKKSKKHLSRKYSKGIINNNGTISPHALDE